MLQPSWAAGTGPSRRRSTPAAAAKAGGVKLCRTYQEVAAAAKGMLGSVLVTAQTGPAGKAVHRLYVEKAEPYVRALYLGLVLDRKIERIRVIAFRRGWRGDRGDRGDPA